MDSNKLRKSFIKYEQLQYSLNQLIITTMGTSGQATPSLGENSEQQQQQQVEIEVKKEETPQRPKLWGVEIRFLVLPLMTVQNAGAVLLMRSVRSLEEESNFSSQTAVIMQELIKGITCIIILLYTEGTITSAWGNRNEALKTVCLAFSTF